MSGCRLRRNPFSLLPRFVLFSNLFSLPLLVYSAGQEAAIYRDDFACDV
jgi:hypothetical protein